MQLPFWQFQGFGGWLWAGGWCGNPRLLPLRSWHCKAFRRLRRPFRRPIARRILWRWNRQSLCWFPFLL